jgi:3-dehydrosphinganine reductase
LGKEISKVLASQGQSALEASLPKLTSSSQAYVSATGAHVTIFARKQDVLNKAKDEIVACRSHESQQVHAVAADMSQSATVGWLHHRSDPLMVIQAHSTLAAQQQLPDTLYCVAGGTANELGFLIDLEPEDFERCTNNNYYASVYPAQAVLRAWIHDDENAAVPKVPKSRKIVFVNSSASLTPIPGYVAYSGT